MAEGGKVGARRNISSSSTSEKANCPEVSIATTPQKVLKVTLLGSEWGSSAGGLSTLNRELAIHLSEHPEVEVTLLVPEGACKDEEKKEAKLHYGISIRDAKECPGYDPLDWLSFPPQDLSMDVVVGHGVKLGRQVPAIRKSVQFNNCKWVQVVHTAPEDLSKYKGYSQPISRGEKKHWVEVDLCKLADLVVPVGPRLEEAYSSYLRRCRKEDIFSVTPGLFEREFGDLEQAPNENSDFKVLISGRGDDEDFELKGYNVAAEAFTDDRLRRKPYHLIFVGAPDGKQDEVRQKLLKCGIAEEQLTVRKFIQSRERMKDLLCEADLAIMPSKSEGFGLAALEALSAGLPILVGSKSGFAKALENVPIGHSCIVGSDDPYKWAEAIEAVRVRHRIRLKEIKTLRASYKKEYSWKEQCEALVEKMWRLVHEPSSVGSPEVVEEQPFVDSPEAGHTLQLNQQSWLLEEKELSRTNEEDTITLSKESPKIAKESKSPESTFDQELSSVGSPEVVEEQPFADSPAAGHKLHSNQQSWLIEEHEFSRTNEEDQGNPAVTIPLKVTVPDLNNQQRETFDDFLMQHVHMFIKHHNVIACTAEGLSAFIKYIIDHHNVILKGFQKGCVEVVIQCPTSESRESLLKDYDSGHLNEVAERYLVTDEIKKKLDLETVRLKITIREGTYLRDSKKRSEELRRRKYLEELHKELHKEEKSQKLHEEEKSKKRGAESMKRGEESMKRRGPLLDKTRDAENAEKEINI